MKVILTKKEEEAIAEIMNIATMCRDVDCSDCPLNTRDDERCLAIICRDVYEKNRRAVKEYE